MLIRIPTPPTKDGEDGDGGENKHFDIWFIEDKFLYVHVTADNAFKVPRIVCIAIAGIHFDRTIAMSLLQRLMADIVRDHP